MKKIFTFLFLSVALLAFSQNSSRITAAPISITGTSVGGWGIDVDFSTADGIFYTLDGVSLTDGALKIRQNHDWTNNWGTGNFPSGVGTQGGSDIPVTAGVYNVTFNLNTKVYTFAATFPKASLIGQNIGTAWTTDVDLSTTDGIVYNLNGYAMPAGDFKFRLDNSWNVSFGNGSFPTGTASVNGSNITASAGTYNITFNRNTGEFSFVQATLAAGAFTKTNFGVYSSTDKNTINFTEPVSQISIYDTSGRLVKSSNSKTSSVDVSTFRKGIYLVDVKTVSGNIYRKKIIKE